MTEIPWQPSASIATLQQRAAIMAAIRQFFLERNVLEVETPLLSRYSVTDPHMPVIRADNPLREEQAYFLQTSPEYAMKRLLASGSGPIYQIAKTFRRGEFGSRHNPEFSMLEWYQPEYSLSQLMDEVEALVSGVLALSGSAERISYKRAFTELLHIDPFEADVVELEHTARQLMDVQMQSSERDDWLHLLMAECVEPKLASKGAVFIYNYPPSQAALARIESDEEGVSVGRRFELYVNGIELANGYDELTDAEEQNARFLQDRQQLQAAGIGDREADETLLAALKHGMPAAAGVALGLDRLMMLALQKASIREVIAFPCDRA